MPYRLRVTQEDVREELAKLGFTGLTDTMVAELRKDLLKTIKNDLHKLRQAEKGGVPTMPSSGCPHTSTPLTAAPPHRVTKAPVYPLDESGDIQETESGYSDQETASSSAGPSCSSVTEDLNKLKGNLPKKISKVTDETSFELGWTGRLQPHRTTRPLGSGAQCRAASRVGHVRAGATQQAQSRTTTKMTQPTQQKHTVNGKARKKVQEAKPLPEYPARADPVNLYHFYKAHWERHRVPGEDPRSRLRWQVRTRLFYLGHKV